MKGRILCIDYGRVRVGLAVTDPDQIIVSGLDTVASQSLIPFLRRYIEEENVVKIVIGHPALEDEGASYLKGDVEDLSRALAKRFPVVELDFQDESYSSQQAGDIILRSGVSKRKRRRKELVDKMSAVLILQEYLGHL